MLVTLIFNIALAARFYDVFDDASINGSLWAYSGTLTESGGTLNIDSDDGIYTGAFFIGENTTFNGTYSYNITFDVVSATYAGTPGGCKMGFCYGVNTTASACKLVTMCHYFAGGSVTCSDAPRYSLVSASGDGIYTVYKNGSLFNGYSGTELTNGILDAGKNTTFNMFCSDGDPADGNHIKVDNFNFTSIQLPQNPVVNISINNTSPMKGQHLNISGTATDAEGLSACWMFNNITNTNTSIFSLSGTIATCSFNYTIGSPRNTAINFTLYVNDTSNSVTQNSSIITVANTAPIGKPVANLSSGLYTRSNQTFNISNVTDADVDSIYFEVYYGTSNPPTLLYKNNTLSLNTTNLTTDSTYYFRVNASDNGLYTTSYSDIYNLTLDTTVPSITYNHTTALNNSNLSQNYIFISVNLTETNIDNISFQLWSNGVLNVSSLMTQSNTTYNFTGLNEGFYAINVTTFDKVSLSNTTETRNITLDTTAPSLIYFVPNTTIATELSQKNNVSASISDSISGIQLVWVQFDNSSNFTMTNNGTVEGYYLELFSTDDKTLNIQIFAVDYTGNLMTGNNLTLTWTTTAVSSSSSSGGGGFSIQEQTILLSSKNYTVTTSTCIIRDKVLGNYVVNDSQGNLKCIQCDGILKDINGTYICTKCPFGTFNTLTNTCSITTASAKNIIDSIGSKVNPQQPLYGFMALSSLIGILSYTAYTNFKTNKRMKRW